MNRHTLGHILEPYDKTNTHVKIILNTLSLGYKGREPHIDSCYDIFPQDLKWLSLISPQIMVHSEGEAFLQFQ